MKEDIKIPLFFLATGLLWINFSDGWLYSLHSDAAQQQFISNSKGYLFVVLSTLMLYVLMRYHDRRLISEQRNLQRQTEENRLLFDVLNKVENYIIITDAQGAITWINQSLEVFAGYSLDEVRGRYPRDIYRAAENSEDAKLQIENALKNKTNCTVEILNYKKNGEKYWISLHVAPLFNQKHELTGFLSIQSNITRHRNQECRLSQQNELLRKVTWMTSHDIRRPLSSILSLVELIKTGTEDEIAEFLPLLYQSAEELDEIIRTVNRRINELDLQNKPQST